MTPSKITHQLVLDVVDATEAIPYYESLGAHAKLIVNLAPNRHTDEVIIQGSLDVLQRIALEHYEQEGEEFAFSFIKPLAKFSAGQSVLCRNKWFLPLGRVAVKSVIYPEKPFMAVEYNVEADGSQFIVPQYRLEEV